MEPLEMTIFRPCGCDEFCEVWVPADLEGPDIGNSCWHFPADKRLSDAELAAEFWFADGQLAYAMDLPPERMRVRYERYATIKRFAEAPHYDEEER